MNEAPADAPRGTLYVAPDGTAYRLNRTEINPLNGQTHENYDVLTLAGSQTKHYGPLPEGSTRVWSPDSQPAQTHD